MGKIKGTKIEGKNEERCFDVLLKSRIPDLNSIRTPSGVLEADLLYKYIMDAHVHQCIGASVHRCIGASVYRAKKGRGTNPTSCKIKSQFVVAVSRTRYIRFLQTVRCFFFFHFFLNRSCNAIQWLR